MESIALLLQAKPLALAPLRRPGFRWKSKAKHNEKNKSHRVHSWVCVSVTLPDAADIPGLPQPAACCRLAAAPTTRLEHLSLAWLSPLVEQHVQITRAPHHTRGARPDVQMVTRMLTGTSGRREALVASCVMSLDASTTREIMWHVMSSPRSDWSPGAGRGRPQSLPSAPPCRGACR